MIQTVEGRLGGSKTYSVVRWICNHLASGGVVATNINLQLEPFTDQYGDKRGLRWVLDKEYGYVLRDEQVISLSDTRTVAYETKKGVFQLNEIVMFYKLVPRGTPEMPLLVAIDEAHIHFPQNGYRSIPMEVLHFLTLSRHACVDIIFISQHIKNMWCQMFRLAEFRWSCRDLQKYGIPLGLINLPWLLPNFLRVKHDYEGTPMKREIEWKNPTYFHAYKSPELASAFESMKVAARVEVKKRKMTMKEKLVLMCSSFALGVSICVIPACNAVGQSKSRIEEVEKRLSDDSGRFDANQVSENSKKESKPATASDPSTVGGYGKLKSSEYYIGHVENGMESKFFTDKRTYRIGDYVDGKIVVLIREHELVLLGEDSGQYIVKRFDSKPREEVAGLVNLGGETL